MEPSTPSIAAALLPSITWGFLSVFGTPRIMKSQAHPHSQADNRVP